MISSNDENKNTNANKNELINNEINDKINTKNNNENTINNECEYKIINNNDEKCKINISPEMTLTELREKIYKFIPRRSIFLNNENKIDPSKEDFTIIKNIEVNKSIYIEVQVEDKKDTMEIEIYLNGKINIKNIFIQLLN